MGCKCLRFIRVLGSGLGWLGLECLDALKDCVTSRFIFESTRPNASSHHYLGEEVCKKKLYSRALTEACSTSGPTKSVQLRSLQLRALLVPTAAGVRAWPVPCIFPRPQPGRATAQKSCQGLRGPSKKAPLACVPCLLRSGLIAPSGSLELKLCRT